MTDYTMEDSAWDDIKLTLATEWACRELAYQAAAVVGALADGKGGLAQPDPKLCPDCKAVARPHDTFCDDEHGDDDECFDFYCDSCGTQFDEDDDRLSPALRTEKD